MCAFVSTSLKVKKPRYRLHCNFGDAKPLWWVSRIEFYFGVWEERVVTRGFSSAAAAIAALSGAVGL